MLVLKVVCHPKNVPFSFAEWHYIWADMNLSLFLKSQLPTHRQSPPLHTKKKVMKKCQRRVVGQHSVQTSLHADMGWLGDGVLYAKHARKKISLEPSPCVERKGTQRETD